MERLQKYLAHAGVASRRQCEEMILAGRVKVNGKVVKELGTKVTPSKDRVLVDGKPIQRREQKVYMMVNKPRGYVSTVKDRRNSSVGCRAYKESSLVHQRGWRNEQGFLLHR